MTAPAQHTPDWPIPGFAAYSVNRAGVVRSIIPWRGTLSREIKPIGNGRGYLKVRLVTPRGRRNVPIHKLMAATFLPPRPSPEHEIRHLNGNPLDNRADNLAWGTRQENADDREAHGRTSRGEKQSEHIKAGLARRRLIAAAPDLFLALRAMLIVGQGYIDLAAIANADTTSGRACLDLARAAIARAEGGQS